MRRLVVGLTLPAGGSWDTRRGARGVLHGSQPLGLSRHPADGTTQAPDAAREWDIRVGTLELEMPKLRQGSLEEPSGGCFAGEAR